MAGEGAIAEIHPVYHDVPHERNPTGPCVVGAAARTKITHVASGTPAVLHFTQRKTITSFWPFAVFLCQTVAGMIVVVQGPCWRV